MGSLARRETFPHNNNRSGKSRISAGTSPEDVFLFWLLLLPEGTDIAEAARDEIARLDRAAPLPPGPARLRELMAQTAKTGSPPIARKHR